MHYNSNYAGEFIPNPTILCRYHVPYYENQRKSIAKNQFKGKLTNKRYIRNSAITQNFWTHESKILLEISWST